MNAIENEIELKGVWKQFKGADFPTLGGVDFKIRKGHIHSLLGYSGVGKSVTIKVILGLLQADRGEVLVRGNEISNYKDTELFEMRKQFGMVFQNAALFDSLNVFENVAFPIREHRKDMSEQQITDRVKDLLGMVNLDFERTRKKLPSELSGGMRKRVGIARAIALKPGIMLFDEPTTGLDPVTSQVIDDLILSSTRALGASALVISHNVHAALRISDFVSMIAEGKIIESAPPAIFVRSTNETVMAFLKAAGIGASI
jgi:phospholipid/cholesterol/gamma-HCH transport system ATP-binding protein